MITPGQIIDGRYRILKRIGTGATSAVFLATHVRAGGRWAVKEIRPDAHVGWEIARNSLHAEIEILKELSHPLLPKIVDVAEDEKRFYVIMEYYEGRSLEEVIGLGGGMDLNRTLQIGIALCDVLQYLHTRKQPVIYRDLKPANIILSTDGQIRLVDFGSAVQYGEVSERQVCDGTPAYAAPEQRKGQYDERTDVFCLGRTLYHLYTGEVPAGQTLSVPDASLQRVIWKCTAPAPKDRYASCAAVARDLRKAGVVSGGSLKRVGGRLALFAATMLFAFVCAGAGLALKTEGRRRTADLYAYYMEQAVASPDAARQLQALRSAMQTDPARQEAYVTLLERVYLTDSVFTREEDAAFHEVLMTKAADGRRYEEILAASDEGMAYVHYRLGLAYFYCYEGEGNKMMAYPHLCAAAENKRLPEERRALAGTLSTISSYYAGLGKGDKSGDREVGYRTYWEDLEAVLERQLPSGENDMTAMMIYQEVLYQLHMNAGRFKAAGVTRAQMEDAAERIEAALLNDTQMQFMAEEEMIEMRGNLMSAVTLTRQTLRTVFPDKTSETVMQAAVKEE